MDRAWWATVHSVAKSDTTETTEHSTAQESEEEGAGLDNQ